MRTCSWAIALLASLGAGVGRVDAQVTKRPTPPPTRTAVDLDWYVAREPIFVHGNYYERAGAAVFFDGRVMVPIALVDGVPIYADTTIEPHSLVFVPTGRGLVQPYERRRRDDIAGTTGSRAPSFPVSLDIADPAIRIVADGSTWLESPTVLASDDGGVVWYPRPSSRQGEAEWPAECAAVPWRATRRACRHHAAAASAAAPTPGPVWTAIRPTTTRGIWVEYEGHRWRSDGPAVLLDRGRMSEAGMLGGVPVYRVSGEPDRIYLPPVPGDLVAPYRRMP